MFVMVVTILLSFRDMTTGRTTEGRTTSAIIAQADRQ